MFSTICKCGCGNLIPFRKRHITRSVTYARGHNLRDNNPMDKRSKEKIDAFQLQQIDYVLIVIEGDEYKKLEEEYRQYIPLWEDEKSEN